MSLTGTPESLAGENPQVDSTPDANPSGENPQVEATSTESTIDLSTPEGIQDALDQLSPEDFERISAASEESEATENAKGSPKKEEPRGENPESPKAEETSKDHSEEPEGDTGPTRISLKSLPESERSQVAAAIAAVKEGKFKSVTEAFSGMFGKASPPDSENPDNPVSSEEKPQVPEAIASIDQEIESLKAARKEAREDFDNEKADDLTDQINAKLLERQSAVQSHQALEKSEQDYEREFNASITSLRSEKPELNDPNTPLSQRVSELRDLAEYRAENGDQKSADLLSNPKFYETLVAQAERELGISKSASNGIPKPPVKPGNQRVGEVTSAVSSDGSLSTEAAIGLLGKMSLDDLYAVGDQIGD